MTRLLVFVGLVVSFLTADAAAQSAQPSRVDLTATARGRVFRIEAGEAAVGGNLIRRVELGRSTAVITYFNRTATMLQPKYRFRLLDAYGIEVAAFEDKWILDQVPPGEAKKEDKNFSLNRADDLLQFSAIALPADWATPVYLLIEGNAP